MNSRLRQIQDWQALARQANWSATGLARICGVSLRTLERHFLKNMGMKPKLWLIDLRHRQAIQMLREGLSVKETALQAGYKYPHHFSREFKNHWGHSPSAMSMRRPAWKRFDSGGSRVSD